MRMELDRRALGETIRTARMKKGLTQECLAEMLDITPIHLKNIEGSRRLPSVPLLFQMMELLDFSVDALVFPERESAPAIHTDGLTEREAEALGFISSTEPFRFIKSGRVREIWLRPTACLTLAFARNGLNQACSSMPRR